MDGNGSRRMKERSYDSDNYRMRQKEVACWLSVPVSQAVAAANSQAGCSGYGQAECGPLLVEVKKSLTRKKSWDLHIDGMFIGQVPRRSVD